MMTVVVMESVLPRQNTGQNWSNQMVIDNKVSE